MEEILRTNKLSFQNIEDQKERAPWVQLLGFMFSCCWTGGLCICCVSALFQGKLPFPNSWKEFVSLPTNMTRDEVHEGIQAHLA